MRSDRDGHSWDVSSLEHRHGFVENAWYAVAASGDVRTRPVGVQRLGRRLVLWRDARGVVHAHDAPCPHRGADLSLGRVVDGTLECRYHGFRFAAEGPCVRMPCEAGGRPSRSDLRIEPYAVREARGIVWLYWGDDPDELPPLPWFDELPRDERRSCTRAQTWRVSLPRMAEAMLDFHHFPFAHRHLAPGMGARLDPYEARIEGDVIRTRAVLRHDEDRPRRPGEGFEGELSVRFPGLMVGRFTRRVLAFVAMTPVDHEHTYALFRFYADVPVVGGVVAWLAMLSELYLVQPDDRRLLESCAPRRSSARSSHFVRADLGAALWYKLYEERLKAQRASRETHEPTTHRRVSLPVCATTP